MQALHPSLVLRVGLAVSLLPHLAFGQGVVGVDLVQVQLIVPAKITPGKTFLVSDEVENTGDLPAINSLTGFILSADDTVDENDLRLGLRRVPALRPQQSSSRQTPVPLPKDVEPGAYYLIVVADATGALEERTKDNNVRATRTTVVAAKE